VDYDSTNWYLVMLLAGVAVGVSIAIARVIFRRDDP